jgi:hypothetical protein
MCSVHVLCKRTVIPSLASTVTLTLNLAAPIDPHCRLVVSLHRHMDPPSLPLSLCHPATHRHLAAPPPLAPDAVLLPMFLLGFPSSTTSNPPMQRLETLSPVMSHLPNVSVIFHCLSALASIMPISAQCFAQCQSVLTMPPPHIHLRLGHSSDAKLNVLFNSGGALSSGYLPYHLWVMREEPDLVASFEKSNDANPFEPIKLGGAIHQPEDYNESQQGRLTAIIRYKTPYVDHDGNSLQISFGLGNAMTVNTILRHAHY